MVVVVVVAVVVIEVLVINPVLTQSVRKRDANKKLKKALLPFCLS